MKKGSLGIRYHLCKGTSLFLGIFSHLVLVIVGEV